VGFAQDDFMGVWKLKEAKLEFFPGAPKNSTVVYEAEGDKVKVTVDSISSDGKPTHYQWTGKFDGKEYSVTGEPAVRCAVVHQNRRPYIGVQHHERRQAYYQRSDCRAW
jgi:ribosomal protein L21E